MGTNYYHHEKPPCPTCGHAEEGRHIGKSSAGWCFSLHVHPDEGIDSLEAWEARWNTGVIRDEYGATITPEEMRQTVAKRGRKPPLWPPGWWGTFCSSEEEFHRQNNSERGPGGLLRHSMHGRYSHCIGHGEGTWDLIVGDFS